MKDLKIKITIDSNVKEVSLARSEFEKLGGALTKGAKEIARVGSKFKETAEILAHTSLAVQGVKSAFTAATAPLRDMVNISANFERQKSILKVLEGDAQGAEKSFEWIKEFAAKTPYELGQVTEAFIKARSYGIDPTNGTLQTLGDTASAMGKDVIQAVEAMADAMVGQNERLLEFGIRASVQGDKVAYSWTSTSGEAKNVIIKNNSEIIQSTLNAIFNEKFAGAMNEQSKIWVGLTSNISDAWTSLQADFMDKSGMFDALKDGAREVKAFTESVDVERVIDFGKEAALLTGSIVATNMAMRAYGVTAAFVSSSNLVVNGSFNTLQAAIVTTTVASRAASLAMSAIPYVAVVGALYAISSAAFDTSKSVEWLGDKFDEMELKSKNFTKNQAVVQKKALDKQLRSLREEYDSLVKKRNDAKYDKSWMAPVFTDEDASDLDTVAAKLRETEKAYKALNNIILQEQNKSATSDSSKAKLKSLEDFGVKTMSVSNMYIASAKNEVDADKKRTDALKERAAALFALQEESARILQEYESQRAQLQSVLNPIGSEIEAINKKFLGMEKVIEDSEAEAFYDAWAKAIESVAEKTDDATDSLTGMYDIYIDLLSSTNEWSNGLDGVAKATAGVSQSFSKLAVDGLKQEKAKISLSEEYNKNILKAAGDETKQKELAKKYQVDLNNITAIGKKNELDGYGQLAGAMAGMFEDGSNAQKAFLIAQQGIALTQGISAILAAASAPPPTGFAMAAAMTSTVASLLGIAGIAFSGGSNGISETQRRTELLDTNMERDSAIVDRLDAIVSLNEKMLLQGTSNVVALDKWAKEGMQGIRETLQDAIGNNAKKGAVNVFAGKEGQLIIDKNMQVLGGRDEVLEIAKEYEKTLIEKLGKDVFYSTTKMTNKWMEYESFVGLDVNKLESYSDALAAISLMADATTLESFNDLMAELTDGFIDSVENMIDIVDGLIDSSNTLKNVYDNITGTTTFADIDKARAKALIEDNLSWKTQEQFLSGVKDTISAIYTIEDAYNVDLRKELSSITIENAASTALLIEQLEAQLDTTFDTTQETLDFIDSIELVGETMAAIADEGRDLRQQIFNLIATDDEKRAAALLSLDASNRIYQEFIYSIEDAQKAQEEALEAKKSAMEQERDALSDYIADVTSNISTLDGVLDGISGTIDKLKAATLGSSYSLQNFESLMRSSLSLAQTDNYKEYAETLNKAISASSVLYDDKNFASKEERDFAQMQALKQFESLEDSTLTQVDQLEKIEKNTRGTMLGITQAISNMGQTVSGSLQSIVSSVAANNPNYTGIVDSAKDQNLGSTWEDKIYGAYRAVTGRTPDANGMDYWINRTDLQNASTTELYTAIARGANNEADIYKAVSWLGKNTNGTYGQTLAAQGADAGIIAQSSFIDLLYEYGLGRAADEDGKQYWLSQNLAAKEVLSRFPRGATAAGETYRPFSLGGYTGDGNPLEYAGWTHKGEYVLNARTTSDLGLNNGGIGVFAEMSDYMKKLYEKIDELLEVTEAQAERIADLENRDRIRWYKEREAV